MSKTNTIALLFTALTSAGAHADTIGDLSAKSRQLADLSQDVEIAKKSNELQQLGIANGSIAPPRKATADTDKPAEDFSVIALHGDPNNPIVDIFFSGVKYERRRGEMAVLGWTVDSISRNGIKFCKVGKGGKECTTRYLSATPTEPSPIGRDMRSNTGTPAPAFAPPTGMPPGMPAPTSTQGK